MIFTKKGGSLDEPKPHTKGFVFSENGNSINTKSYVDSYGSFPDTVFPRTYLLDANKALTGYILSLNNIYDIVTIIQLVYLYAYIKLLIRKFYATSYV